VKPGTLIGMLVVGVIAFVCIPFVPANLGGNTTYVTTHGISMLPRFHAGDLAIVQPAHDYRVGDIAAYHSTTLRGATVLHRIVAISDGRYTFKGDNNSWLDPDHPTRAQIVGKLAIHVPHGGAVWSWVDRPIILFPLLALSLGGATLAIVNGRSRHQRRRGRATPPARRPGFALSPEAGRVAIVAPLAALVAVGGCLVAALAVWHMPRTETAMRPEKYTATATLGYSGSAPVGAAYPGGLISKGDPVYRRLVDHIDITLDVGFDATGAAGHHVTISTDLVAHVASAAGWSRAFVLSPMRTSTGERDHRVATLDLNAIQHVEDQFAVETGLAADQATVAIAPLVNVRGDIDTVPFTTNVAPKLTFQLTKTQLLPTPGASGAVIGGAAAAGSNPNDASAASTSGAISRTVVQAHMLRVWRVAVPAEWARVLALALAALVLGAAAAVMTADRRRLRKGEVETITARYGRLLVSAHALPPLDARPVVHMQSMRALARVANLHEELVVHAAGPDTHRFAVYTDAAVYVYDVAIAGRSARRAMAVA